MVLEAVQTVYLARHGERIDLSDISWYEGPGKKSLPMDPQLTIRGMMQARDLGQQLKGKDVLCVYSSPFIRAVQTSHIICEELDRGSHGKDSSFIRIEKGLSECLSKDRMGDVAFDPIGRLIPAKLLKRSVGSKIDESYKSLVEPSFPENLTKMAERCQIFLSVLLTHLPVVSPPVVCITHSTVVDALTTALAPGTRFPQGIGLGSLTELQVVRNRSTGDIVDCKVMRLADESFVKCKAEYEIGISGFRFATKIFPSQVVFGECCVPEIDLYEDQVVSLSVEAFDPQAFNQPDGIDVQSLQAKAEEKPFVEPDPVKRGFLAFANSAAVLSMKNAVYLAHYNGLAPSSDDIRAFRSRHPNGLDFAAYQQFLLAVAHPEDSVDALAEFIKPFDSYNTGTVSVTTFVNLLSIYGDKLSDREIKQMLKICKASDQRRINYNECIALLLAKPVMPPLKVDNLFKDGGDAKPQPPLPQANVKDMKMPPAAATQIGQPTKASYLNEFESAFLEGGTTKETKVPLSEAVKRAAKMNVKICPKDLGDFRSSSLGDAGDVGYDGFVALVEFVNQRHNVFNSLAGPSKIITTAQAAQLSSHFGLRIPPSQQDIRHFSSKHRQTLTYEGFLQLCEFAEQRQLAFAALAVSSPGGRARIPSDKAGVLASKFGFAPAVEDIQRYQQQASGNSMDYGEFMSFLDRCRHKGDTDVDSMQQFFKPYDPQGTGYVSQKVFRNLLFMFGESYEPSHIDVIIRDMCGNSDPVNYITFINKVLSTPTDRIAVDPLADGPAVCAANAKPVLSAVNEESE